MQVSWRLRTSGPPSDLDGHVHSLAGCEDWRGVSGDDLMSDRQLTLRPSGFRALVAAITWLLGVVLTALALAYRLPTPGIVGLALILLAHRGWRIAMSGRADIWPDGIDNQLAGRLARITVDDVENIRVVVTLLVWSVQVVDHDGSYFTLAGPRRSAFFAGEDFELEVERLRRFLAATRYPELTRDVRKMMSVSQVVLIIIVGAPILILTIASLWGTVI